jgi:hypothetical protein
MTPSTEAIGRGLSAATERFAAELVAPRVDVPDWTEFDWQMARAAAVLHGVTPLLAKTLRWCGPAPWQAFVQDQRRQTLMRHGRITAVLEQVHRQASAAGLPVIALKGAALHALGVYVPGERPMADIDLLVRPADAQRAADVLAALDYAQTAATWKHQVFEPQARQGRTSALPVGEHAERPVKIELHTRIAERLPRAETDITEQVFPPSAQPGINPYPSSHALLRHLLLHAGANMCDRGLRLMHLHDLARLAARTSQADWEALLATAAAPRTLWWALPPLELLERYQPGLIPAQVLAPLRAACPWILRRLCRRATLAQMSYASLAISAFPGLPWCTSFGERVRYIRGRIVPGAEQRALRRVTAAEQWAAPEPWIHLSQGRRIVKWVLSRPPRQASMYIVQSVLASPR